ncbi:SIS domain-containing protein [Tissierella sp. MSJ-40]|uniref:SIS domain-containing protein n=1 Tax=Tissierella simiarum TaxID=2841534 RepID=A0ABS6E1K5_9FIRM|nr:SIS domain-containing protein [Tissierella simiarum]MBU5436783.1 SIS domain-containing protein [Tissierella simiarum]
MCRKSNEGCDLVKVDIIDMYYEAVTGHIRKIYEEEKVKIKEVAKVLSKHIKQDKLVYIWGPGGHSNLASQEIFFRAGGLMHVSAILDGGTLLSNGALRSMEIERLPGYGKIVVRDNNIGEGDLLIIANAYGINSAVIDSALEAKRLGATTIGVSSFIHAESTPSDHVARHPSKKNLHEIVDYALDCKIEVGDAVLKIEGLEQKVGALSTFANAFVLNSLVVETINNLVEEGIRPPIWQSGNSDGGDDWNKQFMERFKGKVRWL